jgi:hypothetical protein
MSERLWTLFSGARFLERGNKIASATMDGNHAVIIPRRNH